MRLQRLRWERGRGGEKRGTYLFVKDHSPLLGFAHNVCVKFLLHRKSCVRLNDERVVLLISW